ncbi:Protein pangolin, isoforms A/H/I/S [Frankliniella fusca]|uniref:Protein pangolin, isoforms A/H/I/S n=1 Tax=Frankliniella fusca TaxID=407009 RepID=A0AAE1HAP7_9NEOP|nr:Protein pangolin, isoforms A/H/I/S [Frankliniella fusca]
MKRVVDAQMFTLKFDPVSTLDPAQVESKSFRSTVRNSCTGKLEPTPHSSSFNMGYLVSPYPYHNGAGGPIPVSMADVYPFLLWSALFAES